MAKPAKKTQTAGDCGASSATELEQLLGHHFARPELLTLALTHRSFVFDGARPGGMDPGHPSQDNEQLEFMGDAVLGLVVAQALCERFPGSREGELTQMRAALVSRRNLGVVGTRLDLGRWLRLGATTEEAGARSNAALLSNAVEALIAALYLDGGFSVARAFVEREVMVDVALRLDQVNAFSGTAKDHKTALQEFVQARGLGRVLYVPVSESGPAHQRRFRFSVRLDGPGADFGNLAEAEGTTKKQAQQDAASQAFRVLTARAAAVETL
jgi:ribonuclease-3